MSFILEKEKIWEENDPNDITFQDPLSETTRKVRRNLLFTSFISLVATSFLIEISSFAGFVLIDGSISPKLTQGIISIILAYLLITFILYAIIDYMSWDFRREVQNTTPYLELIQTINSRIGTTGEQITNAVSRLPQPNLTENERMQDQIGIQKTIESTSGQISSIQNGLNKHYDEIKPLLDNWSLSILRMKRLRKRILLRHISLWVLDYGLPIILSIWALSKGYEGISELYVLIFNIQEITS